MNGMYYLQPVPFIIALAKPQDRHQLFVLLIHNTTNTLLYDELIYSFLNNVFLRHSPMLL